MDNIEKALQELAKAVESNDTVERVKVTITLVKPKPNKAKPDKYCRGLEEGRTPPPLLQALLYHRSRKKQPRIFKGVLLWL